MVSARALLVTLAVGAAAYPANAQSVKVDAETRPEVAEADSPLTALAPVAEDGHRGSAFLRKPPGNGPFPAVLIIHPGITTLPDTYLREYMLRARRRHGSSRRATSSR